MTFKIVTLFPGFFHSPLETGLLGKAIKSGILSVLLIDVREYSTDNYRSCDDYPYGGGSGMVLMPAPLIRAVKDVKGEHTKVVLTAPSGSLLTQDMVKELAAYEDLCLVCGNYEGVDQRFIDACVDYEISVGDYILSGGEYAALVIIDAVSRYIPGFMSNTESLREESFEMDLLEYPHYTRPGEIFGMEVPGILLSGNHKKISEWRLEKSIELTKRVRPDLYKRYITRKLLGE
ncbi:MAG: tRNA (guanosine(37)-N1)-methyltransferase TrmD [Spirochaetes bacterium RBG_16_49_21]|nr:MAG: tRNA (guanosine(37)-N1)-methyltransferase TrmD [Spirochaetes bacterium RBG_16_49_21]